MHGNVGFKVTFRQALFIYLFTLPYIPGHEIGQIYSQILHITYLFVLFTLPHTPWHERGQIYSQTFFSSPGLKESTEGGKKEVHVRSPCIILGLHLLLWGPLLSEKGE